MFLLYTMRRRRRRRRRGALRRRIISRVSCIHDDVVFFVKSLSLSFRALFATVCLFVCGEKTPQPVFSREKILSSNRLLVIRLVLERRERLDDDGFFYVALLLLLRVGFSSSFSSSSSPFQIAIENGNFNRKLLQYSRMGAPKRNGGDSYYSYNDGRGRSAEQ